jgi:hypothetical protein
MLIRIFLLCFLIIPSRDAFSGVRSATICLINKTQSSHHVEVANIENYDWEGDNRPDKNFNNITIAPGATICRYEDTNNSAMTPAFTFVIDNNPTRMTYSQTDEWRTFKWGAYTNPENPTTVYGYAPVWWLSNRWFAGATCYNGPQCFGFELR